MPRSKAVHKTLNSKASQSHTGRELLNLHSVWTGKSLLVEIQTAWLRQECVGIPRYGAEFPGNLQKAGQSVIRSYKAANCAAIRSLPPHLEIKYKHMHVPKCGLERNYCPDNTEWEQEGK